MRRKAKEEAQQMKRKPRQPPKEAPDSLPQRDEGTDVVPDNVRHADPPIAPDSPPPEDGEFE